MIFVTVGAQMPFDRLIRAVDDWARTRDRFDVFAQIGMTEYQPQRLQWTAFMDPPEFRRKVEAANVVIAHAGMGSILTALEVGKPILVMPRRGDLRETRNDHQIATAKRFLAQGRIFVAFDEEHLMEKLDYLDKLRPADRISIHASPGLLAALSEFFEGKTFIPSAILPQPEKLPPPPVVNRQPSTSHQIATNGFELNVSSNRLTERFLPTLGASALPERQQRVHSNTEIKARLAAVVVLAGRLRPTELGKRIGRSRLDLPIDENRTLLTYWRDEVVSLAHAWNCKRLPMRVLLDQTSRTPALPPGLPEVTVSVERDCSEFRGTGGVLRDACVDYDDDAWILVANAAQMLFGSLQDIAERLIEAGGQINIVNDDDGVPNGLILLRCGVLRSISEIGFHDMKEQVIPSLSRRFVTRVVGCTGLTSRPIQSLKDYTDTLRDYHVASKNGGPPSSIGERWHSHFSIKEPGSSVAPIGEQRAILVNWQI